MSKRITIKGVRRKELDYDAIAFVLHTMAKRRVAERRRREAEEKARRSGAKS
jgi:hypothetical protein